MRFTQYITLQILIIVIAAATYAQVASVSLRSAEEQNAVDQETYNWYNEKLNGSFAYFTVTGDINPKSPNGRRYRIFKDDKFRVYGNPVKNKDGLLNVSYRSPDVPGCMYKTCVMGLPAGYLVQLTGYRPGFATRVWDSFIGSITSTGEDTKKCLGCEATPSKKPAKAKPAPAPAKKSSTPATSKDLDRSIAWLKNYIGCDEHEYLISQKKNLLDAQRIFGVPAPVIACLIGRESRWDAKAVQMHPKTGRMWGSYKGLPQTREASLETERNYLNDEYRRIYRPKARRQLEAYLNDSTPLNQLVESNIYYPTDKFSTGNRWKRCGAPMSRAAGDRIGRTAIAFVATYLNRTIDDEVEHLVEKGRKSEANSLLKTKRSRFLMAAGGYNAGSGHTFEMTPKQAYVSDSSDWIENMYPPPFVQDAMKKIEKQCSASARSSANSRKLKPVKTKVKVKTKKGMVWSTKLARPDPTSIKCSSEWLAKKLRPSNFSKQAAAAKHKHQEVRPYVKWIDVCMTADQSKRPPLKGPSLTNPKYLERKNNGCYPADPLKPCPAKPKPVAKPKAKAPTKKVTAKPAAKKAAAKPTPKAAPKGKKK